MAIGLFWQISTHSVQVYVLNWLLGCATLTQRLSSLQNSWLFSHPGKICVVLKKGIHSRGVGIKDLGNVKRVKELGGQFSLQMSFDSIQIELLI